MRRLHWIAVTLTVGAAASIEAESPPGLFGSSVPLEIRIEAPWSQLTRGLESGRTVKGRLIYESVAGEERMAQVSVTTRGASRLDVCQFPPLTLDMKPGEILASPFSDQSTIHLTTQCRKEKSSRDDLIQEYLSYQAYRLIGMPALGVRIALVEYLDTDDGERSKPVVALLVEDLNQAAERLGGAWLQPEAVEIHSLVPETLAAFGLFQFMLGNTDWSVREGSPGEACCHNVGILGQGGADSQLTPVPYDLDCTGLVNPPYAAPAAELPIRTVQQRLYRGFCDSNADLPEAIERFLSKRAELVALVENNALLSAPAKRETLVYLEGYFKILENPRKLKRRILDDCRSSLQRRDTVIRRRPPPG